MANVMFKKGLVANLPSTYAEGTFYVTTDERAIYLDISDSARIRLGDFQEFATLDALIANTNPSTSALYYVAELNVLAKWTGTEYIQINHDTGMTSVEVTGDGNAVTAAVYTEDGRKLILTKGATFATAEALDEEVARAKAAEEANAAAVEELAGKVGEVAEGKTVVQMIEDAKTAATYDDTQVKADIKANTDAIAVLNGAGEGSVDKKITDAFNDFSTKVTDDAVVNSYKELIDWAAEHGSDAAEMAAAITTLQNILAGIGGEGESATVVAYVTSAIEALKIGDYAKASELTALAERVAAMEAKVPAWDAAEQNAKDHADGLNSAMNTRVEALEAIDHEHANAAEIDQIVEGDVAKWNAAQANAEATAAAALAEETERATAAEAKALADAKAYTDSVADELADGLVVSWGSF